MPLGGREETGFKEKEAANATSVFATARRQKKHRKKQRSKTEPPGVQRIYSLQTIPSDIHVFIYLLLCSLHFPTRLIQKLYHTKHRAAHSTVNDPHGR